MARKRNIFQDAKDVLAQGLISVRNLGAFFKQTNRDKRSIQGTKKAARELSEDRRPKEVAAQLGISTQKWTAIRKKIREGKAYSPELREVLKEADKEFKPIPAQVQRQAEQFYIPKESRDKRTRSSVKRAASELSEGRSNKEIAAQLGISPQKWAATKKKIEAGQLYGPELREQLNNAITEYKTTPERMDNGVYYFPDYGKLKKTVKHIDMIKSFGFIEDALDWWETIVNSDTYLAITKKDGMYQVIGLGKRNQRPQKGKQYQRGGNNRVKQLLSKYRE